MSPELKDEVRRVLCQYHNDLRFGVPDESRERRLASVDSTLAKLDAAA